MKVLKDVFNVDMRIGFYNKDYDPKEIYDFHKTNIKNHLGQLNTHLKASSVKQSDNQVVNCKYFIFPMTVGTQYDIYTLSTLMYESYVSVKRTEIEITKDLSDEETCRRYAAVY